MIPKRQQLAAAAATSMDLVWVNKDLLTEILLPLPVKSLIRFKLVCKKWLSLISSDYFCHRHTLRCPKLQQSLIIQMHNLELLYFNPTTNDEKVMIPYTMSVPSHRIVADCNGLLLLEFDPLYVYKPITTRMLKRELIGNLCVYNPATRKSRKITLTNSDKYPFVENIHLVFDPSKSPYYKIVCMRCPAELYVPLYTYQIEVYDSESHAWKLSLGPFTHTGMCGGVHWNNSIYWNNILPNGDDVYSRFDIAKNEMKTLNHARLPYPRRGNFSSVRSGLEESNDHLYYFECEIKYMSKRDKCLSVAVWELGGDDHSQWHLKHHHEIHRQSHFAYPVRFIKGSDGDETPILLIYEHKPKQGRMMAYKFLDKTYEPLVDLTCQLETKLFKHPAMGCFRFGEILALV